MSEIGAAVVKKTAKKKKRRKFILLVLLVLLVMALIGVIAGYTFVLSSSQNSVDPTDLNIASENAVPVDIPLGSATKDIADILQKQGVLKSTTLFKILSKLNGYDGTYQSGRHLIDKTVDYSSMKGLDTLMRILSSRPVDNPTVTVMLAEGSTYKQISDKLYQTELTDKSRLINQAKFDEVANTEKFDYKFLQGLPQRDNRLEGYLFPDTYIFDVKGGEKKIINKMLSRFNEIFRTEYYERAEKMGRTVDEIITIASIVEREAKLPEERELIAGVIYNRLNSKDPSMRKLQVDATIQYIFLNTQGAVKENLTIDDTQIDHPYNTYVYPGLPPGPICSPGKAAIEAALYPDTESKYLFYVAKNDGTGGHYFSKTYDEHLKAKAKAESNKKAATGE